ncbi:MAG: EamA family transporter [Chitinophagaceae bacterium]|nr:EamA family transporter [Chitinophagaceae bacterium]
MRRSYLYLHTAILLWGFTGIFARAIDLTEGVLVWYRLLLTSICWLVIAVVTKKVSVLPLKEALRISFVGLLVAIHWLFFYGSIKYSNISVGMSCLAMIAVFSSILEPLITGRRFQWFELGLAMFAALGMFLIFEFNVQYRTGVFLGLISAFLGSYFTIRNKMLMADYNSETVTTYELCSGFIYLTLLMPLYLWLFPTQKYLPASGDWILLAVFTVVCTVIPFNLSMKALRNISAFTANLSINMEPLYGITLAFIFYHEQDDLHPGFYAGTLIILSSVVIYMFLKFRQLRKSRQAATEDLASAELL